MQEPERLVLPRLRHDDAKRTGARAIVKGAVHEPHLAVERHRQPAGLGADLGLCQLERIEVARLIHAAEA